MAKGPSLTVSVRERAGRNGGRLRSGNPDGGDAPAAFAIRARRLLRKAKALETAANIIEGRELEPAIIDKRIVQIGPKNADKLRAAGFLAEVGRLTPHQASPVLVDNRQFVLVVPQKARSVQEWLARPQTETPKR